MTPWLHRLQPWLMLIAMTCLMRRLWRWLVAMAYWVWKDWKWAVGTVALLAVAFTVPYKSFFPEGPSG
jgi:hypothetical protein